MNSNRLSISVVLIGLVFSLSAHATDKKTGEDGCYYGECPENNSPKTHPRRHPQPEADDYPTHEPDDYPAPRMVPVSSSTCVTANGACKMVNPYTGQIVSGPIGATCHCATAYGIAYGLVQ